MKVCRYTLAIMGLVLLSSFGIASGDTQLSPMGQDPGLFYVKTDPALMTLENLVWEPAVDPTKRNFEDPSRCMYNLTACRPLSWRLEEGVRSSFNWTEVRAMLMQNCCVCIGSSETVTITGDVSAPECYRAGSVDVVVPYTRNYYRVNQNGHVATISVLRPVNGIALIYHDLEVLPYHSCEGRVEPPRTVVGVCVSTGTLPEASNSCPGSGRTKRDFQDPVTSDPFESISWSQIKALYGN